MKDDYNANPSNFGSSFTVDLTVTYDHRRRRRRATVDQTWEGKEDEKGERTINIKHSILFKADSVVWFHELYSCTGWFMASK